MDKDDPGALLASFDKTIDANRDLRSLDRVNTQDKATKDLKKKSLNTDDEEGNRPLFEAA